MTPRAPTTSGNDAAAARYRARAAAHGGKQGAASRAGPTRVSGLGLKLAALALVAASWGAGLLNPGPPLPDEPPRFAIADAGAPPAALPSLRLVASHRVPTDGRPASHASSLALVTERDGRRSLVAYWFSGSRESGPDVDIVSSRYDLPAGRWSHASVVVDRHRLALDLDFWVRRLGNPVAWVDADGRVHLFVVATGLGGWAASRVAHLVGNDAGRSFSALRVLPLSPWFNLSKLVRAPAVSLQDGGALLPLHFELGEKYPIALQVGPRGEPLRVARISNEDDVLQPTILPIDERRAVALLRDHGDARVLKAATTDDGGLSWSHRGATNLPNPDSSTVGARLPGGALVAVLNPSRRGRHELAIAMSRDGLDWRIVDTIESGDVDDEYSYPALLVDGRRLHLTYTYKREAIVHRTYAIDE